MSVLLNAWCSMADHLVPFQPEMVAAIRAGLKVETRRLRPRDIHPGDRLGVQEAVQRVFEEPGTMAYSIDKMPVVVNGRILPWQKEDGGAYAVAALSARYCPRRAVRTWLTVDEVRLERLGEIDDAAAKREGMEILAYFGTVGPRWEFGMVLARGVANGAVLCTWSDVYRAAWEGLHGNWDPDQVVQVIRWVPHG